MSFDARSIIAQVREGHAPSGAAMAWFAQGLADHTVSDAQAAAFAMAVCLKGLPFDSRVDLTRAMRDSGPVLHWDLDGPVLDITHLRQVYEFCAQKSKKPDVAHGSKKNYKF